MRIIELFKPKKIKPMDHEKVFQALADFVQQEEVKKVVSTGKMDPGYYLLNPQIKISVYLNHQGDLEVRAESNGDNGFTEFKKKYSYGESGT